MKKRVFALWVVAILLVVILFSSCSGGEGKLVLDNNNITMKVGDTYVVNVFSTEAKEALTWSSSDNSVASVDDGTITANAAGSAVITVMSFKGLKEVCNVKVTDIEITKVSLDTTATVVDKGKCVQLNATVYPTEAKTDSLDWTSSNDSVASVDSEGYVSGLKAGTAVIKCIAPSGKTASCTVTVKGKKKSSSSNSKKSGNTINNYYYGNPNEIGYDYSEDFVFYDSSQRYLSDYEVEDLSSDTIQRAINEIYARNGYIFQNKNIRSYYEDTTSWYRYIENPNFSQSDFNSYEKANLNLLLKYK